MGVFRSETRRRSLEDAENSVADPDRSSSNLHRFCGEDHHGESYEKLPTAPFRGKDINYGVRSTFIIRSAMAGSEQPVSCHLWSSRTTQSPNPIQIQQALGVNQAIPCRLYLLRSCAVRSTYSTTTRQRNRADRHSITDLSVGPRMMSMLHRGLLASAEVWRLAVTSPPARIGIRLQDTEDSSLMTCSYWLIANHAQPNAFKTGSCSFRSR